MTESDRDEFRNAVRQIGYYSMKLDNPYVIYLSPFGAKTELQSFGIEYNRSEYQEISNKILNLRIFIKNGYQELKRYTYRVRVSEWVRKLISLDDESSENITTKNEYIQLLKIQVTQTLLQPPFTKPPPETALPPLSELLGNLLCEKIPGLPKPGPLTPSVIHKSPDGRAYISIKHVPGDGILCYMAVTPDPSLE